VGRLILLLGAGGLLAGCGGGGSPSAAASPVTTPTPSPRPNLVVILADDLDVPTMGELDSLHSLLATEGVTFTSAYATHPVCSPSRVSFLTGQYTHNHRSFATAPPFGGYPLFRENGQESTIATLLHDAGYRTALVGKYLNVYPSDVGASEIPPGWDRWFAHITSFADDRFYNYFVNDDGQVFYHGTAPEDYETDVLAAEAAEFIVDAGSGDPRQPFFLFVSLQAPHAPATPAPRHEGYFNRSEAPRVPSFNEEDVSDKPAWVQNTPLLSSARIRGLDQLQRGRLASMLAVEDLINRLFEALVATGELDRTYLVFTSDHGLCMGMHRLFARKSNLYDESIRIPLYVRGPGVARGRVVAAPTVLIDVTATLADLAGVSVPAAYDGRSLRQLIHDGEAPSDWRQDVLVEGFSAELDYALRTPEWAYVEHSSRERELYDMRSDPYQLENVYRTADPALIDSLAARLEVMRTCAGENCRR